uniref:palmitoyl-protein hydrolase n=1 Tax=Petromyzon marinus TaxID=7757 RepID=A0AAJ7TGR9_PETMA|nr:acyl-protein thioesterase 1-like isoform X2 [Petromyzon marinus]
MGRGAVLIYGSRSLAALLYRRTRTSARMRSALSTTTTITATLRLARPNNRGDKRSDLSTKRLVCVAITCQRRSLPSYRRPGEPPPRHGWAEVLSEFKSPHIKYVCPHAPLMPVTLNLRQMMPSWFDIIGLSPDASEDEDGIKRAAETVRGLIEQEIKAGIPSHRIVLAGFSQSDGTHAGVPVLQCHGEADVLVPPLFGQLTADKLRSLLGPDAVTFKTYRGLGHSSTQEEMIDVKKFLETQVPDSN